MRKDRVVDVAQKHNVAVNGSVDQIRQRIARAIWASEHPQAGYPEEIAPMLAQDAKRPTEQEFNERFKEGVWVAEHKYNGVRGILYITRSGIRIISRRRSDITHRYVEKQRNVPHLQLPQEVLDAYDGTVLDGELRCPKDVVDTGKTVTVNRLQAAVAILNSAPEVGISIQDKQDCRLSYVAFHLIRWKGHAMRSYQSMRPTLEGIVRMLEGGATGTLLYRVSEVAYERMWAFYERLVKEGHEGVVMKRVDLEYQPGKRVKGQLKCKRFVEVDGFVTGHIPGEHGFTGLVGALEVSAYREGKVCVIAHFSNIPLVDRKQMTGPQGELIPEYYNRVVTVRGAEWTRNKLLFHCQLVSYREDKAPEECRVNF